MIHTVNHFLFKTMTQVELATWLVAKRTDAALDTLYTHALSMDRINTESQAFGAGIALLVSKNILTQARADAILAL